MEILQTNTEERLSETGGALGALVFVTEVVGSASEITQGPGGAQKEGPMIAKAKWTQIWPVASVEGLPPLPQ